jgi:hypothetical protein
MGWLFAMGCNPTALRGPVQPGLITLSFASKDNSWRSRFPTPPDTVAKNGIKMAFLHWWTWFKKKCRKTMAGLPFGRR